MSYDQAIAKELAALSRAVREKARYFDLCPADSGKCNYEQAQTTTQALNEIAVTLENIIAKYFIYHQLFTEIDQSILTRQCRTQIKRTLRGASAKQVFECVDTPIDATGTRKR